MALDDHHVIGNQSMPAIDEVESAFTLSDSAVPQEKDADAIDVEKTGMHRDFRRHRLFEEIRCSGDGHRRQGGRREKRNGALLALVLELVERRDALRNDEAGDIERGDVAYTLLAQTRGQRLEIFRFRLADDLDAPRLDVFVVAGEGEAGLLNPWPQDRAIEAVVAGDELQRELIELRGDERPDRGLEEVFLVHGSMVRQWSDGLSGRR